MSDGLWASIWKVKYWDAVKAGQIENQAISIPADLGDRHMHGNENALVRELKMFGYEKLPSGMIRYTAPEGMYDDCVIALALATRQTSKPKGFFM